METKEECEKATALTQIADFDMTVLVYEDVVGLEIPMQNIGSVEIGHCLQNLVHEILRNTNQVQNPDQVDEDKSVAVQYRCTRNEPRSSNIANQTYPYVLERQRLARSDDFQEISIHEVCDEDQPLVG